MKKVATKKVVSKEVKPSIKEYALLLLDIKKQVQAQLKAALSANKELIKLYWSIGKTIVEQQKEKEWGTGFVEKLANDLQSAFPEMGGFSRINVFRMRALYLAYEKALQLVIQIDEFPVFNIPWGHNVVLLIKLKDENRRLWYAQKTIENGWSRSMLESWIKSDLYKRQGKVITNFTKRLPALDSDMAQQSLKDPYVFDFFTLHEQHLKKDLEHDLIANIQDLLLELGKGFAFIGRQYHLQVGKQDFYIDLLYGTMLVEKLPKELKGSLPTIEEIQQEL